VTEDEICDDTRLTVGILEVCETIEGRALCTHRGLIVGSKENEMYGCTINLSLSNLSWYLEVHELTMV
jgi:hypothetical protein